MTRKHKHGELTQAQASQHKQANTSTTSKQANSHKHDKQANTSIVSKQAKTSMGSKQRKTNMGSKHKMASKHQTWRANTFTPRQDNQANKAWQANTFRQTNISMARKNDHGELSQAWQPKTSDTASKYIHAKTPSKPGQESMASKKMRRSTITSDSKTNERERRLIILSWEWEKKGVRSFPDLQVHLLSSTLGTN